MSRRRELREMMDGWEMLRGQSLLGGPQRGVENYLCMKRWARGHRRTGPVSNSLGKGYRGGRPFQQIAGCSGSGFFEAVETCSLWPAAASRTINQTWKDGVCQDEKIRLSGGWRRGEGKARRITRPKLGRDSGERHEGNSSEGT